MSKCRSCGAPIIWTVDANTNRAQPLDAEPTVTGNIEVTDRFATTRQGTRVSVSRVVPRQDALFGDVPARYLSHFVTCPQASDWRDRGTP